MPKLSYNKFSNEYMIAYMVGYCDNNPMCPYGPSFLWTYYNVIERVRINNLGAVQGDGSVALWPTHVECKPHCHSFQFSKRRIPGGIQ